MRVASQVHREMDAERQIVGFNIFLLLKDLLDKIHPLVFKCGSTQIAPEALG